MPSNGKHWLSATPNCPLGHVYRLIMNDKKNWRQWIAGKDKSPPDFTDERYKFDVIKTYMDGLETIADKQLMTVNLQGQDFLPPSIAIEPGQQLTSEQVESIQGTGRFFVKPSLERCGRGIQVVDDLSTTVVNRNLAYTVQREVIPKLYEGRKCDWRSYATIRYENGKMEVFVYGMSLMRICAAPFSDQTMDALITNFTYQKYLPTFNEEEQYRMFIPSPEDQEQINKIVINCMEVVRNNATTYGERGILMTAFDLIKDENDKLWILEFNNWPGVSYRNDNVDTMFGDYLYHLYLPMKGVRKPRGISSWTKVFEGDLVQDQSSKNEYVRKVSTEVEFDPMNLVA